MSVTVKDPRDQFEQPGARQRSSLKGDASVESFYRLFAPSGKTARFALTLAAVVVLCLSVLGTAAILSWLFLVMGHGELIEQVLIATTSGVGGVAAGVGGLLGYQRLGKPSDEN